MNLCAPWGERGEHVSWCACATPLHNSATGDTPVYAPYHTCVDAQCSGGKSGLERANSNPRET